MPEEQRVKKTRKRQGKITIDREEAFAFWYLRGNCNASLAARKVGASNTDNSNTAGAAGHFWLKRPNVRAAITRLRREIHMDSVEVLQRLGDHARGSIDDVLDENGNFSIEKARENGAVHLIREVSVREVPVKGGTVIERKVKMYDAQSALVNVAKHHDLLTPMFARQGIPTDPEQLKQRLEAEMKRIARRSQETEEPAKTE